MTARRAPAGFTKTAQMAPAGCAEAPDNREELHGDGLNDRNGLRGQRPGGA